MKEDGPSQPKPNLLQAHEKMQHNSIVVSSDTKGWIQSMPLDWILKNVTGNMMESPDKEKSHREVGLPGWAIVSIPQLELYQLPFLPSYDHHKWRVKYFNNHEFWAVVDPYYVSQGEQFGSHTCVMYSSKIVVGKRSEKGENLFKHSRFSLHPSKS